MKPNAIVLPEYHHLPLRLLHRTHETLINASYLEAPKAFRQKCVGELFSLDETVEPEEAHRRLVIVLSKIEFCMAEVLRKHSIFYWIHLYRRLAPHLSDELGINTSAMTLLGVRCIAEQAIFKFGKMTGKMDLSLSSEVPFDRVLGGHLAKSFKRLSLDKHEVVSFYAREFVRRPQWIIKDFRPSDLAKVYEIEGFAYQYWYISAKMRAAGKNIPIKLQSDGHLQELWDEEQRRLIDNFDDRISQPWEGFTSNVGTYIRPTDIDVGRTVAFVSLNVGRDSFPVDSGLSATDIETGEALVNNYLPGQIDVGEFYFAHRYLAKSFNKKNGFGLQEFCLIAAAISILLFTAQVDRKNRGDSTDGTAINYFDLHNLLQRGYIFYGKSIEVLERNVRALIVSRCLPEAFDGCDWASQLKEILGFLTLSVEKTTRIGLWSEGQRFVIVPYQDKIFFDLSAWPTIFKNLFFGLRQYDPKSLKGIEFEATFAGLARSHGLDIVIESKKIRLGGFDREVDVAIRLGDTLVVCECRAAERPLDFQIGNPKTIQSRCDDFQQKIEQVLSLETLFISHPRGSNYDTSWARRIVSLVVSPYTEWIWSLSPDLWVDPKNGVPRIMSAPEAIRFIKSLST